MVIRGWKPLNDNKIKRRKSQMKKIVALFLAMVMLLSMASFAAAEEPFVITVMVPEFTYDADYVEEGNPILAKIEELTGVRLKM